MIEISFTDRVFIPTGAEISAESGIPAFRDAGGLWRNHRFEEVASLHAWERDPRFVWEFYSMRRRDASQAKPNPGQFALAKLEGTLQERLFLCTQNVDSIQEYASSRRAPFDDASIYEPSSPPGEPFSEIPRCHYGGRIRPHICWFGEVPYRIDEVFRALGQCTAFVAIGTSGVVEPAASFVAHVRSRARTFYVGPEEPANHSAFTKCFLGKTGELLPDLFRCD